MNGVPLNDFHPDCLVHFVDYREIKGDADRIQRSLKGRTERFSLKMNEEKTTSGPVNLEGNSLFALHAEICDGERSR